MNAELEKAGTAQNRRRAMTRLVAGLSQGLCHPLPRKRNTAFSTTQSVTQSGESGARVQILGLDAGHLKFDPVARGYVFLPNAKSFSRYAGQRWNWSHDRADAAKIHAFLAQVAQDSRADPEDEREIQWQLANALRNPKTHPGAEALRNLSPVTWCGRFNEIGVSINLEGKAGTGNIDLLVRRRGGFLVFEVKRPTIKVNVEGALHQALRYAAALHVEANEDSNHRRIYRQVFGASGDRRLNIGAVVVLQDLPEIEKDALRILPKDWPPAKGVLRTDRLGVLLYDFSSAEKKIVGWRWLPGWDPRVSQTPRIAPGH